MRASIPLPPACKAGALPSELIPRNYWGSPSCRDNTPRQTHPELRLTPLLDPLLGLLANSLNASGVWACSALSVCTQHSYRRQPGHLHAAADLAYY